MFLARLEPATFRLLGGYTTETKLLQFALTAQIVSSP